jgi:hypothetical protein
VQRVSAGRRMARNLLWQLAKSFNGVVKGTCLVCEWSRVKAMMCRVQNVLCVC